MQLITQVVLKSGVASIDQLRSVMYGLGSLGQTVTDWITAHGGPPQTPLIKLVPVPEHNFEPARA